jgi:hypothetical protein
MTDAPEAHGWRAHLDKAHAALDAGQSSGMKNHPALDATSITSRPNKDLEKAFFG